MPSTPSPPPLNIRLFLDFCALFLSALFTKKSGRVGTSNFDSWSRFENKFGPHRTHVRGEKNHGCGTILRVRLSSDAKNLSLKPARQHCGSMTLTIAENQAPQISEVSLQLQMMGKKIRKLLTTHHIPSQSRFRPDIGTMCIVAQTPHGKPSSINEDGSSSWFLNLATFWQPANDTEGLDCCQPTTRRV